MFIGNSSSQSSVDSSLDPLIDSNNVDEQQLTNINNPDSQNNRLNMIIYYGKELLCLIAIILTTYASVQSNSPKVSRAASPVPFFSQGSLIEDYYYGQLTPTQTKVTLSDLSFVLYYAPWSAESQNARSAYEHVSRLFYREAYFSAINCWQPGSECRNQYTKIHSWPILMAYQRNGFGIQYQKNLWTEGALTKFINSLLTPIQRLTSPDDLLEMMTSKDALIVAFVDLEMNSRHYRSFYYAALKFLEKDPFNEIGFAVVTGLETSLAFGVETVPSIRAYLWNETLEYDGNKTWSSREINKWANNHLQMVALNLSPPGTKASSLAPYLKSGPVLILFTPRNFYTELSDPYVMLQQIGMEYYNCGGDNWVQEMARDYLFERRKENRLYHNRLETDCRGIQHQAFQSDTVNRGCSSSVSVSITNIINSSKNFESKFKNMPNFCELPKDSTGNCQSDISYLKQHLKYSQDANTKKKRFETSMLDNEDDSRSPKSVIKYNLLRKCEMLKLGERNSETLFLDDEDPIPLQLVSGLACKSNKTFTLMAMDSVSFHTFAERLGIDILEMENKTAAIIMDHENESTYLLDEPINLNSLTRFLYTYHRGGLTRFLRTNSVLYKHTHFFDMNEFLIVKKKENSSQKDIRSEEKCEINTAKRKFDHVVIREIYSQEFDDAVVRSNKTAVVLFFSANCAFCSMMTHSVLTVSRILEGIPEIEFFRIDGDKNDLAWQYTMAEYPSLIIFPANAKSESRRFPPNLSINVGNILGFVLANLRRSQRLLGLVSACNYKRMNHTNDCISTIQEEITDTISFLLRGWRKNPLKRAAILRIIKHLKEIYLNLFAIKSSCDFLEIEKDVRKLIDRWQKSVKL